VTIPRVMVWPGKSGKSYRYFVYDIGASFKAVPGNYIFANASPGKLFAVHIGHTDDLSEDFENHPKIPCIRENGANQIHVHVNDVPEDARKAEEKDLIEAQNPPCNKKEELIEEKAPSSDVEANPMDEQNTPGSKS